MENTNSNRKKVTVLGLGQMGITLAELLLKQNYEVTVWNRTLSKAKELEEKGAKVAETSLQAVQASDIVVLCVFDYEASNNILLNDATATALKGKTLIQFSTGSPKEAQQLEDWTAKAGTYFLTGAIQVAPEQMAKPDTTILISGSQEAFDLAKEVLYVFGGNIKYLGTKSTLASAMDLATLSTIYGTLLGFFHGARISEMEGFDVRELGTLVAEIMPSFTGFIQHEANVIHSGDFNITQSPLAISIGATQRILDASTELGINTDFPKFAASLLNKSGKLGYADQELAAVIKTLRETTNLVQS